MYTSVAINPKGLLIACIGEGLPVDYSKLGGDYLQCNVYKSGMDTMTAVSRISSITRFVYLQKHAHR